MLKAEGYPPAPGDGNGAVAVKYVPEGGADAARQVDVARSTVAVQDGEHVEQAYGVDGDEPELPAADGDQEDGWDARFGCSQCRRVCLCGTGRGCPVDRAPTRAATIFSRGSMGDRRETFWAVSQNAGSETMVLGMGFFWRPANASERCGLCGGPAGRGHRAG